MTEQARAEEHLRVIRGLMERATVYRAISAPAALVGGLLAVAVSIAGVWLAQPGFSVPHESFRFLVPWLLVLAAASVTNVALLHRGALDRGEPFLSSGMRLALRAMLPALLAGGIISLIDTAAGWASVAALWALFYGISLLAASHFAPRSICWLGRAFFVAGFVLTCAAVAHVWKDANATLIAHLTMGVTFGVFHLIYAACVWPRSQQ